MPVSALIVNVTKDSIVNVRRSIAELDGAEVAAEGAEHLVVVTDSPDSKADYKLIQSIEKIDGVCQASVVFNASDELLNGASFSENPDSSIFTGLLNDQQNVAYTTAAITRRPL